MPLVIFGVWWGGGGGGLNPLILGDLSLVDPGHYLRRWSCHGTEPAGDVR